MVGGAGSRESQALRWRHKSEGYHSFVSLSAHETESCMLSSHKLSRDGDLSPARQFGKGVLWGWEDCSVHNVQARRLEFNPENLCLIARHGGECL